MNENNSKLAYKFHKKESTGNIMKTNTGSNSNTDCLVLDLQFLMNTIYSHVSSEKNSLLGVIFVEVENCSQKYTKYRVTMVNSFLNFLLKHPNYEGLEYAQIFNF